MKSDNDLISASLKRCQMEEIRLTAGGRGFAASYYKTLQPPCRAIEIHPFWGLRTTFPGGGSFSGTMPCDAYEIYQIMAVSPFDGWRQHLCPGGTMGAQHCAT